MKLNLPAVFTTVIFDRPPHGNVVLHVDHFKTHPLLTVLVNDKQVPANVFFKHTREIQAVLNAATATLSEYGHE